MLFLREIFLCRGSVLYPLSLPVHSINRGVLMEIEKRNGRIVLSLSDSEADEAGLCYETFEKGDRPTEVFLRSVLARLRDEGLLERGNDCLDIEVSETEDGLMISISERRRLRRERVSIFTEPAELALALGDISAGEHPRCELWKCGGCYAVISESAEADQMILAAKIREYGKLLSDSPFELI